MRLSLSRRVGRKLRHLWDAYLVERLLGDGLTPAVAPALFPRRQRAVPDPRGVRTVLVWNVDSPGDFLWVTPTLRAVRRGYPGAAVTLVCNRACVSLAETNPHVDRVVAVNPSRLYTGRGVFASVPELNGVRFDVMLVLEMGSRPADAGRVFGRRAGVGYLVSSDLGLLKSLPDHTLPPNEGTDWPSYFLSAAAHLGLPVGPPVPEAYPTKADDDAATELLGPADGCRVVALHPQVAPYALTTKKWPDDSFVETARLLAGTAPTRFVLTGSADEADACRALAERVARATGAGVTVTAGRLSLRGTVALYRRVGVVIVADTAALHLAAAAGTPAVALFGSTDDRRIAPRGAAVTVLNARLPCAPCHRYADRGTGWPRCQFARNECMHAIHPADVARAAESLLLARKDDG